MIRAFAYVLRFVLRALWMLVPLSLVVWVARYCSARGPMFSSTSNFARLLRLKEIRGVRQFRVDEWDIRLACVDSHIVKNLYFFGARGYEYGVVKTWRSICAETNCAVEIGANIGLFCLAATKCNPALRYRTYEPLPVAARVLRENLELNDLTTVVDLVEAAVVDDDSQQTVQLNIPQGSLEDIPAGSFVAGLSNAPKTTLSTLIVPAIDVRDAIAGAGAIKIDAEGVEPKLLERGLNMILETQPEIIVEILQWDAAFRRVVATLSERGDYSLYVILEQGLKQIDHNSIENMKEAMTISRDFLLSSKPRHQTLQ
jgi:FkbM family methyltransferase